MQLEKDFKAPSKKIDGLISNIMAYGLWLDSPEDTNSYLEEGNLYII
jgi:hypothetical protein